MTLLFALATIAAVAWPAPVATESGLLAGTRTSGGDVRVFKGIPYAAPPVGPLRWRAPQPPAHWAGIRPADHFGPICVQVIPAPGSFYQQEYYAGPPEPQSEDCLYLNVWTGALSPAERRPVMVWIYGGAGIRGSGSEACFDGEALARRGVVVVTFNYRVNIFGWFAHPDLRHESEHSVSGNYAELDQIAALGWVRRNIAGFGGDPARVTVFGQSSGGASINRLLIAPPARGLFQRAILESAGSLTDRDPSTPLAKMEQRGQAFAAKLGAASLAQLRALPADQLLAAGAKAGFGPVIDGWLLPALPEAVFAHGGLTPMEVLLGSNSGDPASYVTGARAKAGRLAKAGDRVYLYYFDRAPPGRDQARRRAFHGAETEYVFGTLDTTDRPWEPVDRGLSNLMGAYWTRFAASGNPNASGLPAWPIYRADTDLAEEIGLRVGPLPSAQLPR